MTRPLYICSECTRWLDANDFPPGNTSVCTDCIARAAVKKRNAKRKPERFGFAGQSHTDAVEALARQTNEHRPVWPTEAA